MKKIVLGITSIFLTVFFCGLPAATGKTQATLAPPTALKLVIVPDGFKLSWQPSPDDPGAVTGYEIVRSDLASGPFAVVGTVNSGVTQYVDKTAAREIIYYYKVRAIAGTGESPFSNTVTGER